MEHFFEVVWWPAFVFFVLRLYSLVTEASRWVKVTEVYQRFLHADLYMLQLSVRHQGVVGFTKWILFCAALILASRIFSFSIPMIYVMLIVLN